MSGERQHFIPRFLMEGFASYVRGNNSFTWVYPKAGAPFNTNTINVGVERQFYTDGKDTQADDLITAAEGKFSSLVHDLRQGIVTRLVDPLLPQLIAHLEIRTRNLRKNFLQSAEFLASNIFDNIFKKYASDDFLLKEFQSSSSKLRQSLISGLAERRFSHVQIEQSMQRIPMIIDPIKANLRLLAEVLRPLYLQRLKQTAKSGHITVLKTAIAPEMRVVQYKNLSYTLAEPIDGPLILGDSIVFFHVDGPRAYKAFLDKEDALKAVFLPLDARTLLVAAIPGFSANHHNLREAIARCSLEYFIATDRSSANELLKDRIGVDAALLTKAELEEILAELS